MLIRECFQMFCLATADYRRERLLSLCSILGLAAVLAPPARPLRCQIRRGDHHGLAHAL